MVFKLLHYVIHVVLSIILPPFLLCFKNNTNKTYLFILNLWIWRFLFRIWCTLIYKQIQSSIIFTIEFLNFTTNHHYILYDCNLYIYGIIANLHTFILHILNGKKLNVEKDIYILTKYFWDNFVMIFNVFEYSDSLDDVSSGKIINELHWHVNRILGKHITSEKQYSKLHLNLDTSCISTWTQ